MKCDQFFVCWMFECLLYVACRLHHLDWLFLCAVVISPKVWTKIKKLWCKSVLLVDKCLMLTCFFCLFFFLKLVNRVTTRAQIPASHVKCVQKTPSARVMEHCCAPAWRASSGPLRTLTLLLALVSVNTYFLLLYKVFFFLFSAF